MYNKLTNEEWENIINEYYSKDQDITVKDYCQVNNINKGQFYYHKRRLNNKNEKVQVFHAINFNDETDDIKQEVITNNAADVTVMIGNAKISIPVSETTLISTIIKELTKNV